MKKAVIILAVLAAGLAFAFFRARQSAGSIAQQAQAQLGVSSNRIAELEMKLNHQEQLARALGSQFTNRLEELARRDADVARLRADAARTGTSLRETCASLSASAGALRQLRSDLDAYRTRIAELESLIAESDAKSRAAAAQFEMLREQRSALALQLAETWQTVALLEAKLQNPDYLRAQVTALRWEDARPAETNRVRRLASPAAQTGRTSAPARQSAPVGPLELRDDGSVGFAPAR